MTTPTTPTDPNEILVGTMTRAAFLELAERNPVAAARLATTHNLHDKSPYKAPTATPSAPAATSEPPAEVMAKYLALREVNCVAAARFAAAHGLHR